MAEEKPEEQTTAEGDAVEVEQALAVGVLKSFAGARVRRRRGRNTLRDDSHWTAR